MEVDRWTIQIELDSLEVQRKKDPELTFPHDECSALVGYLRTLWAILPEELQEFMEWGDDKVTIQLSDLGNVSDVLAWVCVNSIPKSVTVTRNEERSR